MLDLKNKETEKSFFIFKRLEIVFTYIDFLHIALIMVTHILSLTIII